jgi:hypothetical protein
LQYEFQEQLPSTQQEEIFHKFQLQKQFSLFHSKFPQMLYQDTGKPNYKLLSTAHGMA